MKPHLAAPVKSGNRQPGLMIVYCCNTGNVSTSEPAEADLLLEVQQTAFSAGLNWHLE